MKNVTGYEKIVKKGAIVTQTQRNTFEEQTAADLLALY